MFRSLLIRSAQSGIRGNAVASEYFGALSESAQSRTFGSLIKRFQSTKPFNQCTNTCKCPNSAKINDIESLVLPTYFLTCGIGGYVIGDMIFTAIQLLNKA